MNSRLLTVCLTAFVTVSSGCKTSEPASSALRADSPTSCAAYPLTLDPAPQAEAKAEAALSKLMAKSPKAVLDWSEAYRTPKAVNNIDIEVACSGTEDVVPKVAAALSAQADLFRFDASEWMSTSPISCAEVKKSSGNVFVRFNRNSLGSQKLGVENLTAFISATNKGFVLSGTYGTYLPPAATLPNLVAQMKSCGSLSKDKIVEAVRAIPRPIPFMKLFQCQVVGPGEYKMSGQETVTFKDAGEWMVTADPSQVQITHVATVEVELPAAAITPEIRETDMYCAVKDQQFAGFKLRIDTQTRDIIGLSNGIRDCVTC